MKTNIRYEKLSKKEQRRLDLQKRGSWMGVNPVTRKVESSKAYNRKRAQRWKDDSGAVFFIA